VDIGSWRGAAGFLADQLNRDRGAAVRLYRFLHGEFLGLRARRLDARV
jgi:hypothetical protein